MPKRLVKLGAIFLLGDAATFLLLLWTLLILWPSSSYMRDLYDDDDRGGGRRALGARAVMRCRRCALVTSSGHVLGSGAGDEIDGAECVIRMNDAPTAGYERDVGTRTTLRLLGHRAVDKFAKRNWAELLEDRRVPANVVFWGLPWYSPLVYSPLIGSFCRVFKRSSNCFRIGKDAERAKFDALYRKETGLEAGVGSQNWLSTGFIAMAMATESCDRVTVYGMVPPDHCAAAATAAAPDAPRRTAYHYYQPDGPGECEYYLEHEAGLPGGSHRFITEKRVYARWAQTHNITFAHPSW